MDHLIRLEQFEGPLDLLCHLIDKNEVDLYNIPIAAITKQYMEYIYSAQTLDLDVASEFLVMAATLVDIKSRMLLPDLSAGAEDGGWEDPRTELVERIMEYRRYKEASDYLRVLEDQFSNRFFKEPEDLEPIAAKDTGPLELDQDILVEALKRVLDKMDRIDTHRERYFKTLRRDPFTVEEKMNHIQQLIKNRKMLDFTELFAEDATKNEVITTFLALLELLRGGTIGVQQESHCKIINIVWKVED